MRRRILLQAGVSGSALLGSPPAAWAQDAARVMRLGWLRPNAQGPDDLQGTAIRAALRQLGWAEGQNLAIEVRFADGKMDRMPALAAELVRARCDALIAVGATAVAAARGATSTIPIVMFGNFDPVARGFVSSLARPGGNVTGVLIAPDGTLASKKLELLKEAVPRATRIGLLVPDDPAIQPQIAESRAAAAALALAMPVVTVRGRDHERAFATLAAEGAHALLVGAHTFFMGDRKPIIELALRHRLASSWEWPEQVRDGGLMAYGTSLDALYLRIASYVDRIFKGALAADLPVERPSKFDLVINLKTARAIGLVVPQTLLLRADEVVG